MNGVINIRSTRGSSCVEVSSAAIRTVGEPGFALCRRWAQTDRTVTAGSMRRRQSPPLAQHHGVRAEVGDHTV